MTHAEKVLKALDCALWKKWNLQCKSEKENESKNYD